MRNGVLTVLKISTVVFCFVTLRRLVGGYQRFNPEDGGVGNHQDYEKSQPRRPQWTQSSTEFVDDNLLKSILDNRGMHYTGRHLL